MRFNARFFVSLIIILIVSWLDVHYVGEHKNPHFPLAWNQVIHLATLLVTMGIGYLNVRYYPEKWLSGLWLFSYCIVICILLLMTGLYFAGVHLDRFVVATVLGLRNVFIGCLPFLVFFIISLLASRPPDKIGK